MVCTDCIPNVAAKRDFLEKQLFAKKYLCPWRNSYLSAHYCDKKNILAFRTTFPFISRIVKRESKVHCGSTTGEMKMKRKRRRVEFVNAAIK